MKRIIKQVVFPATYVVVMAAFLSTFIFATANPSFAASTKKKATTVTRISAVERTESRIKQLQSALKITGEQDTLWNNLTQVMRENAKEMDALTKDRTENAMTMDAVESLKFNSQMTEAHLNQMKKFLPPFEALYASMSDEQKKTTDTLFRTGKHGKHRLN
ncbi:MAG: Spy/CpxP family protein refolding chaperone [Desulfuromonadales bacterium]|nr:Spy/CpxP family protein refolding chaperone [Desulfuromonadales bacterium]